MRRIIDLSYPIEHHWRPAWRCELYVDQDFERTGHKFRHSVLTIDCHAYTHIDATGHFFPRGRTIDQIPLEQLVGPAVVIDVSSVGANEPVTADLLAASSPAILPGDRVLVMTRWDEVHPHTSLEFLTEAPYMTADACHWLVSKRVSAVGYDFTGDYWVRHRYRDESVEWTREDAVTHNIILREDIVLIEYVTNLSSLRRARFDLVVAPINVIGAEGMPVRVVAIEEG